MIEVLIDAYPDAHPNNIARYADPLDQAMRKWEINSPIRITHFLAQVGHESGQLRYVEEIASGEAYEWRKELGNVQKGDGILFKGRGAIQLTGRANYTTYSRETGHGKEFVLHPERIAEDPVLYADVAGWFWHRNNLNTYADRDSILTITRRINGGYNGLEDRKRLFGLAKEAVWKWTQRLLNDHGANLVVDGIPGRQTRLATIAFQQRSDLTADGIVGPITFARLRGFGYETDALNPVG